LSWSLEQLETQPILRKQIKDLNGVWRRRESFSLSLSCVHTHTHAYTLSLTLLICLIHSNFSALSCILTYVMNFFCWYKWIIGALNCRLLVDLNLLYAQSWRFHRNHMVKGCLLYLCTLLYEYAFNVINVYRSVFIYNAGNIVKESGPVSMTFTIPMYNASRLQVKS
jgi:hypothetical protein